MVRALVIVALLCSAACARACQTALLLAMDVSNSVDPGEYRLQINGLAAALRDPEIAEILVQGTVALSVMQWSGPDKQEISLDWHRMLSAAHVAAFAQQVTALPRAFVLSNTAPAEALDVALDHMARAPVCARRIIDVSGDGTPNAGEQALSTMQQRAQRAGVTVNGLAIESLGLALTNFYRRSIVTRDGFVETAQGHRDYARAIRRKILREISRVVG